MKDVAKGTSKSVKLNAERSLEEVPAIYRSNVLEPSTVEDSKLTVVNSAPISLSASLSQATHQMDVSDCTSDWTEAKRKIAKS